jgi:hypothetical protein
VREQLLASTAADMSLTDACRTEGRRLNTIKSKVADRHTPWPE